MKFDNFVFVRHNLDLTNQKLTLERMFNDRVIALDFEAVHGSNPDNYSTNNSKNAMHRLNKYCREGALVGADYNKIGKLLVGEIKKGSEVKTVDYDGYAFYKTVHLENAVEVNFLKYPVLLALQPRLATISGWPKAAEVLEAVYFKKPLEKVTHLSDGQLEVLCFQYMKELNLIDSLLLPVGRTLRDIDILGYDKDGYVAAQVTFSNDTRVLQDKAKRLLEYKEGAKLYMFSPECDYGLHEDIITFCDIEKEVFDFFARTKAPILKFMLCSE